MVLGAANARLFDCFVKREVCVGGEDLNASYNSRFPYDHMSIFFLTVVGNRG